MTTLVLFGVFIIICLVLIILMFCAVIGKNRKIFILPIIFVIVAVCITAMSLFGVKVESVDQFILQYSVPVTILEDDGTSDSDEFTDDNYNDNTGSPTVTQDESADLVEGEEATSQQDSTDIADDATVIETNDNIENDEAVGSVDAE